MMLRWVWYFQCLLLKELFSNMQFMRCLKEIVKFENTQDVSLNAKIHPKNSMTEAKDLVRCFARK